MEQSDRAMVRAMKYMTGVTRLNFFKIVRAAFSWNDTVNPMQNK